MLVLYEKIKVYKEIFEFKEDIDMSQNWVVLISPLTVNVLIFELNKDIKTIWDER